MPDPVTRTAESSVEPTRLEGYGRYDDDPTHIGCPRAATDMTPCVARDGINGCADDGKCAGCARHPAELLTQLVRTVTSLILLANETDLPELS